MPHPKFRRREFIKSAGLTGLAVLLGGPGAAAQAPAPGTFQLGCYTRPFDQFDWQTAFDSIAEAGFQHVGLMTTNTKDWVMVRPSTPAENLLSYRQEAARRGLGILSIYGDFTPAAETGANVKSLRQLVEHCRTAGCQHLLLGGTTEAALYDPYYEAIKECCPLAAEHGVHLSIKPHGGQNATGPQCRKAIQKVGHRSFGLWYDPGNIFYYSDGKLDPVEDATTVDGLVTGMSVKDFLPPKEVLVNPGDGRVDFASVMKTLRRGGFNSGPLVLECLKRGSLEETKSAARKARELMQKLAAG